MSATLHPMYLLSTDRLAAVETMARTIVASVGYDWDECSVYVLNSARIAAYDFLYVIHGWGDAS